jgi:phage terminase large subunit-like protein
VQTPTRTSSQTLSSIASFPELLNPAVMANKLTNGMYQLSRHGVRIGQALKEIVLGNVRRLLLHVPPQHGKTTIVGEWFPPYLFAFNPGAKLIYTSYEAEFAEHWSARAREHIREHGRTYVPGRPIEIDPVQDTRSWWGIKGYGGYMASAGMGGPVTGKGANVLVIDDPHKNAEDARSPVMQAMAMTWLKTVAMTRVRPDGAIIVIQTRWDENDLIGQLLTESPDEWTYLRIPALADEEDDPVGRKIGEPLWPEAGWTREAYERKQTEMGAYWFAAMYQGLPVPAGGAVFKRSDFRYAYELDDAIVLERPIAEGGPRRVPKSVFHCFQTVDLAASVKTSADYFVIETWLRSPWNELILVDVLRTRVEGPDQIPLIFRNREEWNAGQVGIEKTGYQLTAVQSAIRAGLPVVALDADKDKFGRALALAARYEAHQVWHLRNCKNIDVYEAEVLRFNPMRKGKDDMVDCAAYAARFLFENQGRAINRGRFVPQRRWLS